ncbi:MAG TPA: pentapeptide repeat-containing protein [Pseudolabrys sp.]|nr:pentapeptide repeat-containing protein [Pseudolabrys sp.]
MTEKLDPFDIVALERSLNDCATRVSTIWVSYLIFALYLLIATGTATHRQLFLEEPLKLPALNIDLPLYWFFILAPILFVLLHFYVLLQVLLLGRTAAAYNEAVNRAVRPPPQNALVRQRLANTLFAQIFAGSPREREGWLGRLLHAMAWITLALSPIYVILAFQFVFLPYHSHFATFTHRFLLLAELVIAFLLWPLVLDARRDFNWYKLRRQVTRTAAIPLRLFIAKDRRRQELHRLRLQAIPLTACIFFVAVSLSLGSFPGEPHVNLFTGNSLFAVQCNRGLSQKFDRLVLPRVDVVEDEKLDKIERATAAKGQGPSEGERTRSFRERDLSCGTFDLADLRRADFAGARMSSARFIGAELQGTDLRNAQLQGADLSLAQLQGASLAETNLRGADLSVTQLQDAELRDAQLQGADLSGSQLQGADLSGAQLQGANLRRARLQSARLRSTWLQGANLSEAELQGADLGNAWLQGADLSGAQLQYAELVGANLQGIDLSGAKLQGADISNAQLQGADLQGSELKLASLSNVNLWRATNAHCSDARIIGPKFDAVLQWSQPQSILVSTKDIKRFIEGVVDEVGIGRKREVRERLSKALVVIIKQDDLAATETNWRNCASSSEKVTQSVYLQQRADFLRDLFCKSPADRQEIAVRFIENPGFGMNRKLSSHLARSLLGLGGEECAATKDLSNQTKERLRAFASTPITGN